MNSHPTRLQTENSRSSSFVIRLINRPERFFLGLFLLYCVYFLSGVQSVPFHPDESTNIFMSRDFSILFSRPAELFWNPQREGDPVQRYRELDAPITRDLIGLAGALTGTDLQSADWDWTRNWAQNVQAGAMPDPRQLLISRLAIALLFPGTLYFIYKTGTKLAGPWVGFLCAAVLAAHPLALLHARRAMAEGMLLLGVAFFIYAVVAWPRKAWLIGLAAVIAVNSKQSAYALVPIGLLAIAWSAYKNGASLRRIVLQSATYFGILLAGIFLLNPILWSQPIRAFQASWTARQDLVFRQLDDLRRVAPNKTLDNPGIRLGVAVTNLYIAPPAYEDYPNYATEISSQAAIYRSLPGNEIPLGIPGGGVLIFLTLIGLIYGFASSHHGNHETQIQFWLVLAGTIIQALALSLTVPLPYQRYFLPLLPWIALWIALGGAGVFTAVKNVLSQKRLPRVVDPGQEL